ncbi:MAG: hypothetical protein R2712_08165 [Vicinamibacterales bacterium]
MADVVACRAVDDARAAFAEDAGDLIGTDVRADGGVAGVRGPEHVGGQLAQVVVEHVGGGVGVEHGAHPARQVGVAAGQVGHETVTFGRGPLDRGVKDVLDALPSLVIHAGPS